MFKSIIRWFRGDARSSAARIGPTGPAGAFTPAQPMRAPAPAEQAARSMAGTAPNTVTEVKPLAAGVASAVAIGAAVTGTRATMAAGAATASPIPAQPPRNLPPIRVPEHHEIAQRAYQLWLQRGGDSYTNWIEAERQLLAEYNRR
jgi:hypothetical protein